MTQITRSVIFSQVLQGLRLWLAVPIIDAEGREQWWNSWGGAANSLQPARGSRSVVRFPNWVYGRAPARTKFGAFWTSQNTIGGRKTQHFKVIAPGLRLGLGLGSGIS